MFLQLKIIATYMLKKGVSAIFMLDFYNWFINVDSCNGNKFDILDEIGVEKKVDLMYCLTQALAQAKQCLG